MYLPCALLPLSVPLKKIDVCFGNIHLMPFGQWVLVFGHHFETDCFFFSVCQYTQKSLKSQVNYFMPSVILNPHTQSLLKWVSNYLCTHHSVITNSMVGLLALTVNADISLAITPWQSALTMNQGFFFLLIIFFLGTGSMSGWRTINES